MTTQWDRSVDLLIAGSGGGGMVAGLAALDCGLEPLIVEKQALVGGSTGLVRRHRLAAQQPADAGRRHRRFARGRPGLPGRRRRRHRRGVVARAPRDVSHRGLRDDQFPDPQGRSADPVRGLERLLPEPQGRQRVWPRRRGNSLRRRRTGQLERQGAAAAGQELRVRGADQRAALGAVFQPFAARVRRGDARCSRAPRRRGYAGARSSPTAPR